MLIASTKAWGQSKFNRFKEQQEVQLRMRVRDRAEIPLQIFRVNLGEHGVCGGEFSAVKHETV